MTTVPNTTSPPASGSGGMAPDEKKAATVGIVGAFLLGGPLPAIIAALAVGIEQAFARSGWERPDWTQKHASMTPQEVADRRRRYAEDAAEYLRQARERSEARRAEREAHRQRMREWLENDKKDDKPGRPGMRNPWEFLRDFLGASKSWYRLFDEKMAKGNEKVNDAYGSIGDFFRHLWNFFAGLYEGTREGWREYQEQRQRDAAAEADSNTETEQTGPDPQPSTPEQYHWGTPDGSTPEPAAELPDGEQPSQLDPPGHSSEDEPEAGSGPAPDPEPLPSPDQQQLPVTDSSTGPTGPEGSPAIEGELMGADGLPIALGADVPDHMGQQGLTNLDLLFEAFEPARPVLAAIPPELASELNDTAAIRLRLHYIVALANVIGAPPVVAQMVAECYALINGVERELRTVEEHHETAHELTEEALAGLAPASEEQENIHAQGASGDALNRAGH